MRPALAALLLMFLRATARADEPGLHAFTLANGLVGVVIEDHRAPVVNQTVWFRVGSRDDPAGRAGTAHFLEHLMFKATGTLADGEYSRTVTENGGDDNAFTTMDQTAYVTRIAADRLDLVMGMEADRMSGLAPSAASVASERDVVMEERRQQVDGDPAGVFRERLMAALYPVSAEGRPTIGPEAEIAALNREDALAFHRAHYAPNDAVFVVAGDVETDAVRALAERHFGPIPAAAVPPRPTDTPPALPAVPGGHRVEMRDARVSEPQFTRLYRVSPRRPGAQREAAAFVVLADLIGGQRVTSLMARTLVRGDGIALAGAAFYGDTALGPSSFGIAVVPKPGIDAGTVELAVDALIAGLAATGPEPGEIDRIRGRIRAEHVYALDDLARRADGVGEALTSGLTLDDVEAWPLILASVTPAEVQAAAATLVRADRVTGWLLPGAEAAP